MNLQPLEMILVVFFLCEPGKGDFMKFVLAMALTVLCMNVHARTLHYDEYSVELTDTQKTFPALHILIDGTEHVYVDRKSVV